MTHRVIHEKKRFPLTDGIPLPSDMRHHRVDDHHLFTSVGKASFVVTDDLGAAIVRFLSQGATLGEVLREAGVDSDSTTEAVQQSLHSLLVQVERNGFTQQAIPVEDDLMQWTVLCYLTNRCNLACSHCYQGAGPTIRADEDMQVEEWRAVFADNQRFLERLGGLPAKITLSGGEPLVHPGFQQVLEAAGETGATVEVFTNGTLIRNEAVAKRLARHAHIVQISLDGASEEVNDSIRGRGTHRKILRALHLLAETPVALRIAVTLMPCNIQDVQDNLISVIDQIGHGRVEVRMGLANIQGRADHWARFRDGVEGERVLRDLLTELYSRGLRRPSEIQSNFRQSSCGYGRSTTIAADGTVYGCALQRVPLGNVRKESFYDLAERSHGLSLSTLVDQVEGCRECDLRFLCNGGCRLNNHLRHNRLDQTACTPAKRLEIMQKLVHRELAGDPLLIAAEARVTGFWEHA